MAQHRVFFKTPRLELGNADIELKVLKNGKVVGTLKISKGNLLWIPRDAQKGYTIGWAKCGDLIRENGQKVK